jgi:indole-3-acetate monooxygenase
MTTSNDGLALLETARGFAPEITARAREGEELRTMPDDLVHKTKAAGLFRLGLPRSLGGFELDPASIIRIVEVLCEADGSAGWTILIGNNNAFFAWLDPDVAREIIGGEPDFASNCMFSPLGAAVPAAGGFTLNGRWPFSSGCRHAEWLQTGMFVMDGDHPRMLPEGRPDWRFAFIPRDGVQVIDTWDAMGLRGTGSHDISVSGLDVPEEHTASPFFEPPRHDGPLWRLPFFTLASIFLIGFPLGVARRALEEFTTLAPTKKRAGATEPLAADAEIQVELARAEGVLRSARAYVFDAIGEMWATAEAGDEPTLAQRAQVLLATQHAMRAGVSTVDTVFSLAGAGTVYSDHPLQRCFRDITTARQHVFFSSDALKRYAKTRLGIEQPTFMV